MIVPDVNLLLYAYNADVPQHAVARAWLEELFANPEEIGLPWMILWAFARISTNVRAGERPLQADVAFRIVSQMVSHPHILEILETMVVKGHAIGSDWSDAVLAALVVESGATLASNDADFSRFPGLKWFNPLAAE